ncbi:MAG: hypothetical protein KC422_23480 [Trueperaceae bacterium]|nr:hypothetical protein [Trueperaceae bacterium]
MILTASIISFIGFGLFAVMLAMLLAPIEALGWWAGWYRRPRRYHHAYKGSLVASKASDHSHYVIYLDGIAKGSYKNFADVQTYLDGLKQALPEISLIDVLPYSVTDIPLTRYRPMSRFWRFARERKLKNDADLLGFSINLSNLFQVFVSADKRYGPLFNYGMAEKIIEALLAEGYPVGSGKPITIIGYSGGGQIAAGVAPYLKHLLRAPVDLISLGGVISADPGLKDLRYIYHLSGDKDSVEKLGTLFFPGRWPLFQNSSWNYAKRKGKFTYIPIKQCKHNGAGGYLDENCKLDSGDNNLERTLELTLDILCRPADIHAAREKRGPFNALYARYLS